MYFPFLKLEEANQINVDFHGLLGSSESVDISIDYKVPLSPVTDPVYGDTTATQWVDKRIKTKAIQRFVRPSDVKILQFGILEVGDCIFYISQDVELYKADYQTGYIKAVDDLWTPLQGADLEKMNSYIVFRVGERQIGQVIPCKLKK